MIPMNMYLDHTREPELYKQAEEMLKYSNRQNKITVSFFQRRLSIGYARAYNLLEDLLENKVIKPTEISGVYKIR